MTHQEFIEAVAKAAAKYAPQFNIKVISPVIAQACLESGYGTSEKAKHHNYFGLKYRKNRVTCNSGFFKDGGSEQNKDGSYTPINTDWYAFPDLETGVLGYFQFINTANYSNLKNVTDPHQYLENIKADGYATSQKYVENVYRVITLNNLTKYDNFNEKKEEKTMGYTNSPLINYTKISPNKTPNRNHVIDTITIHCMAGNLSVETCGNVFANPSRKASSNYGVGSDGRIGLYVDEKDRSWCSSNAANDHRAITIEVANDGGAPDWHVSDKALAALINLVADICKRNGIKKLLWKADKKLIGQVDKQNMTVHRWFAAKACPGDYLFNKHGYIADEVNKKLGAVSQPAATPAPATKQLYRVRKTWEDVNSQTGAYSVLENAKKNCKEGYTVYDWNGKAVYTNKPQKKYTVQKGDSYWKIATKFLGNGARWPEIAAANGGQKSLHPGDVLIIPQ